MSADGGSLADIYPCGVSIVFEGAFAGGPSLSLPGDMPAGACFTARIVTANDIKWPEEEIFWESIDAQALKAMTWRRKWLVVSEILSLDISGEGLTSAINVTSGIIYELAGDPQTRPTPLDPYSTLHLQTK